MKIQFVDEYFTPIETYELTHIPRIGDRVNLKETYYVTDTLWQLDEKTIYIFLTDQAPVDKVKNITAPDTTGLRESSIAHDKSMKALKETKDLKRQVFNLTQQLKQLPKKPN
jgi:hypothetical protein